MSSFGDTTERRGAVSPSLSGSPTARLRIFDFGLPVCVKGRGRSERWAKTSTRSNVHKECSETRRTNTYAHTRSRARDRACIGACKGVKVHTRNKHAVHGRKAQRHTKQCLNYFEHDSYERCHKSSEEYLHHVYLVCLCWCFSEGV